MHHDFILCGPRGSTIPVMSINLPTLIAYLIALAIPLAALYIIRTLDLFGTTRLGTLILCMVWGAVGAFGLAYLINTTTLTVLVQQADLTRNDALRWITGLSAPIIEEILKAGILVYLIRRPNFRYFVDGAIYGFCVGIGFAVIENYLYIAQSGNAALSLAASRVLSTSLMHAIASALVGISLGLLRRASDRQSRVLPIVGIIVAIVVHVVYNNIVINVSSQIVLLVVAISIGVGGAALIGYFINQGLKSEKRSFTASLGMSANVSDGERMAIQRLGGSGFEGVIEQLRDRIGDENITLIRKMMVVQANIGILRNNLAGTNISPRLRTAWEEEVAEKQDEFQQIRKELGRAVMGYMQTLFPTEDESMWRWMQNEMGSSDPTMVHTFDMFMRQSGLAANLTPEQLERLAERLHKIEIFRNVSMADLENLGRAIETVTFDDRVMLFDQGDEGDAMYMIVDGAITIYSVNEATGQEAPLRTFQAGAVVGDFAVLDGQPRSARARAASPLVVLVLQRQMFKMFIQSRPQVILAVLKVLADKARYTTSEVQKSIQSISAIAQGNYADVAKLESVKGPAIAATSSLIGMSADMFARMIAQSGQEDEEDEAEVAAVPVIAEGVTEMSGNVHVVLNDAFARLARTLQKTENTRASS